MSSLAKAVGTGAALLRRGPRSFFFGHGVASSSGGADDAGGKALESFAVELSAEQRRAQDTASRSSKRREASVWDTQRRRRRRQLLAFACGFAVLMLLWGLLPPHPSWDGRRVGAHAGALIPLFLLARAACGAASFARRHLLDACLAVVGVAFVVWVTLYAVAIGVPLDVQTLFVVCGFIFIYPPLMELPDALNIFISLAVVAPLCASVLVEGGPPPPQALAPEAWAALGAANATALAASILASPSTDTHYGIDRAYTACMAVGFVALTYAPQRFLLALRRQQRDALEKLASESRAQLVLLKRVIPEVFIDQLLNEKKRMTSLPVEDVTVLFAEVVVKEGLDGVPRKLGLNVQQSTLSVLAHVFKVLDRVIKRNGVHKVETIGSELLAVCGLPVRLNHHPNTAYMMCLVALDALREVQEEADSGKLAALLGPGVCLSLQIGLHSGPVVEGILGRQMLPRWKLFGDTVNTASRMKSTGVYGRIHVSRATRNLVMRDAAWVVMRGRAGWAGVGGGAGAAAAASAPPEDLHCSSAASSADRTSLLSPFPPAMPPDVAAAFGPLPRGGGGNKAASSAAAASLGFSSSIAASITAWSQRARSRVSQRHGLASPPPPTAPAPVAAKPALLSQRSGRTRVPPPASPASTAPSLSSVASPAGLHSPGLAGYLSHGPPPALQAGSIAASGRTVGAPPPPPSTQRLFSRAEIEGTAEVGLSDADVLFARASGFFFRPSTAINIKGKGIQACYYLELAVPDAVARRAEAAAASDASIRGATVPLPVVRQRLRAAVAAKLAVADGSSSSSSSLPPATKEALSQAISWYDDPSALSEEALAWFERHLSVWEGEAAQLRLLAAFTRRRPRRWSGRGLNSQLQSWMHAMYRRRGPAALNIVSIGADGRLSFLGKRGGGGGGSSLGGSSGSVLPLSLSPLPPPPQQQPVGGAAVAATPAPLAKRLQLSDSVLASPAPAGAASGWGGSSSSSSAAPVVSDGPAAATSREGAGGQQVPQKAPALPSALPPALELDDLDGAAGSSAPAPAPATLPPPEAEGETGAGEEEDDDEDDDSFPYPAPGEEEEDSDAPDEVDAVFAGFGGGGAGAGAGEAGDSAPSPAPAAASGSRAVRLVRTLSRAVSGSAAVASSAPTPNSGRDGSSGRVGVLRSLSARVAPAPIPPPEYDEDADDREFGTGRYAPVPPLSQVVVVGGGAGAAPLSVSAILSDPGSSSSSSSALGASAVGAPPLDGSSVLGASGVAPLFASSGPATTGTPATPAPQAKPGLARSLSSFDPGRLRLPLHTLPAPGAAPPATPASASGSGSVSTVRRLRNFASSLTSPSGTASGGGARQHGKGEDDDDDAAWSDVLAPLSGRPELADGGVVSLGRLGVSALARLAVQAQVSSRRVKTGSGPSTGGVEGSSESAPPGTPAASRPILAASPGGALVAAAGGGSSGGGGASGTASAPARTPLLRAATLRRAVSSAGDGLAAALGDNPAAAGGSNGGTMAGLPPGSRVSGSIEAFLAPPLPSAPATAATGARRPISSLARRVTDFYYLNEGGEGGGGEGEGAGGAGTSPATPQGGSNLAETITAEGLVRPDVHPWSRRFTGPLAPLESAFLAHHVATHRRGTVTGLIVHALLLVAAAGTLPRYPSVPFVSAVVALAGATWVGLAVWAACPAAWAPTRAPSSSTTTAGAAGPGSKNAASSTSLLPASAPRAAAFSAFVLFHSLCMQAAVLLATAGMSVGEAQPLWGWSGWADGEAETASTDPAASLSLLVRFSSLLWSHSSFFAASGCVLVLYTAAAYLGLLFAYQRWLAAATQVGVTVALVLLRPPSWQVAIAWTGVQAAVGVYVVASSETRFRSAFVDRQLVCEQQDRTRRMLTAMLPPQVVDQMMARENVRENERRRRSTIGGAASRRGTSVAAALAAAAAASSSSAGGDAPLVPVLASQTGASVSAGKSSSAAGSGLPALAQGNGEEAADEEEEEEESGGWAFWRAAAAEAAELAGAAARACRRVLCCGRNPCSRRQRAAAEVDGLAAPAPSPASRRFRVRGWFSSSTAPSAGGGLSRHLAAFDSFAETTGLSGASAATLVASTASSASSKTTPAAAADSAGFGLPRATSTSLLAAAKATPPVTARLSSAASTIGTEPSPAPLSRTSSGRGGAADGGAGAGNGVLKSGRSFFGSFFVKGGVTGGAAGAAAAAIAASSAASSVATASAAHVPLTKKRSSRRKARPPQVPALGGPEDDGEYDPPLPTSDAAPASVPAPAPVTAAAAATSSASGAGEGVTVTATATATATAASPLMRGKSEGEDDVLDEHEAVLVHTDGSDEEEGEAQTEAGSSGGEEEGGEGGAASGVYTAAATTTTSSSLGSDDDEEAVDTALLPAATASSASGTRRSRGSAAPAAAPPRSPPPPTRHRQQQPPASPAASSAATTATAHPASPSAAAASPPLRATSGAVGSSSPAAAAAGPPPPRRRQPLPPLALSTAVAANATSGRSRAGSGKGTGDDSVPSSAASVSRRSRRSRAAEASRAVLAATTRGVGGVLSVLVGAPTGSSSDAPVPPPSASAYRRARCLSVGILMVDLVGFTALSADVGPRVVVELLDRLYASFDRVVARHGAVKIETIGDAMLVACGAPSPVDPLTAARSVAKCGVDMLRCVDAFTTALAPRLNGHRLSARVGVHFGQVLAGVIGDQMPRYQLFGPAVDEAGAMEQSSEPGQVHASAALLRVLDTGEAPPEGEEGAASSSLPPLRLGSLGAAVDLKVTSILADGSGFITRERGALLVGVQW